MSADTIVPEPGNPQALNRYMYVQGNPLRYIDPTGHFTEDQIMRILSVDTWDNVLALFDKGGALEGRWGWLEVLRQASNADLVDFGNGLSGSFTYGNEMRIFDTTGSTTTKTMSLIDAAKLSDNYTLQKNWDADPFYEFVNVCGGYSCTDGENFTTSAFTRYEKYRGFSFSELDVFGLGLDVFGLLTAGAGDEFISIGGRIIGSADEVGQMIGVVDVVYGAFNEPDIGILTDIGGLVLSGPYGMAMDGFGIVINVGGAIRYGP